MAMVLAMGLQPMLGLAELGKVRSPVCRPNGRGECLSWTVSRAKPQPPLKTPLVRVKGGRGVGTITASSSAAENKDIIPDKEITITKTSFGTIGLTLGISLLSYGFGAYFTVLPGSEVSALLLTYGFPLTIIGMALKYAELKPVPNLTYANAFALREAQATDILTQVRNDVTRYRYGDEQHLDEALKRIFRYGQAGGIPRRFAPKLQSIREEVTGGNTYTLVLVFEAKSLKLDDFKDRQGKFTSFFGPGVTAKISAAGGNTFEVALIADGGPQAEVSKS